MTNNNEESAVANSSTQATPTAATTPAEETVSPIGVAEVLADTPYPVKKGRVPMLIAAVLCAALTIFVMAGALFGTSDEYSWFSAMDIILFIGAPLGLLTILLGFFVVRERRGLVKN